MDFEWLVPKTLDDIPEKNYINPCCVGGDVVLEKLKSDVALGMNVNPDEIDIYQEDWGWGMEFLKDEIFYLLAVNNSEFSENGKTLFSAYVQATGKVKKAFLSKWIDAPNELKIFSEVVSKAARKNGFEGGKIK